MLILRILQLLRFCFVSVRESNSELWSDHRDAISLTLFADFPAVRLFAVPTFCKESNPIAYLPNLNQREESNLISAGGRNRTCKVLRRLTTSRTQFRCVYTIPPPQHCLTAVSAVRTLPFESRSPGVDFRDNMSSNAVRPLHSKNFSRQSPRQ